jgi:hypothetical protein
MRVLAIGLNSQTTFRFNARIEPSQNGDFIVTDKPTPIASYAAGQIAIQTLLSVLINLYIGECEDHDLAKREITCAAEGMIDNASVPDLPAADQKEARDQAKFLVRALISVEV